MTVTSPSERVRPTHFVLACSAKTSDDSALTSSTARMHTRDVKCMEITSLFRFTGGSRDRSPDDGTRRHWIARRPHQIGCGTRIERPCLAADDRLPFDVAVGECDVSAYAQAVLADMIGAPGRLAVRDDAGIVERIEQKELSVRWQACPPQRHGGIVSLAHRVEVAGQPAVNRGAADGTPSVAGEVEIHQPRDSRAVGAPRCETDEPFARR